MNLQNRLEKHYLKISFIVVFLVLFFFMGYNTLWSTGPYSTHTWRQSDSYSFALTYYYDDNKFFEPSILFVGEDGHGRSISEFPIIYFLTAKIWKVTGPTPGVLRFLNLLVLFIGLYHLLLLSFELLKDRFWALFTVLLLFSSPLLGFFSFNFIPNIPAFGFALMGLYYLFRFLKTKKTTFLITYTILYTLAALVKITALFSLLAVFFVLTITQFKEIKNDKATFSKLFISFLLITGIYFCWYQFSINYNFHNLGGIFNQSILPIWDLDKNEIWQILEKFYFNILPQYFNLQALIVILLSFIGLLIFHKKTDKWLIRISGVLLTGTISFILLFFQGLNVHDYFLIDTLVFIPAIIITLLHRFINRYPESMKSAYSKTTGILILAFLLNNSMINTRSHYNPNDPLVKYNLPLPAGQRGNWDYNYYMLTQQDFQYQGIDTYLRKIGITYNDKVISLDDHTPNKTLSFMHLKGFTDYHYDHNYNETDKINRLIELGATYLVICGNDHLTNVSLIPYLHHPFGKYNNVYIYKLEPLKRLGEQTEKTN